jgi:hypothetical protein
VAHPIPVQNQLHQHPAAAGFFIACAVENPCHELQSPKEPLISKATGSPVLKADGIFHCACAIENPAINRSRAKNRSSWKGTGSPVPKSKPKIRALAPEVRFESFNPPRNCPRKRRPTHQSKELPMSKNNITNPVTDQEIAFVHLVLSGTMTDRQAAEAVGLNPDTAAYTKAKPRVLAYMLEHRATEQERLVQQEVEERRRVNLSRDRVLARLWQIADLDPEMTRNSASSQMKALSLIVAIEGLIPDRRAVSPQNKPAPLPVNPPFYVSEWMRNQQAAQAQEEAAPEPPSALSPDPAPIDLSSRTELSEVEGPAVQAPVNPTQAVSPLPRVPMADYFAPDTRRPFSIDRNRFGRRR